MPYTSAGGRVIVLGWPTSGPVKQMLMSRWNALGALLPVKLCLKAAKLCTQGQLCDASQHERDWDFTSKAHSRYE